VVAAGLVDLASGNPDPALLPPLDTAVRALNAERHLYGEPSGLGALIAFLAADFESDGVPSSHLMLANGALDGMERVLREHLRPGDAVAVEDPTFPGVLDLLAAAGYERVPFAVDDEGPVPEGFAGALRRARAAIVTPRAQNPTGAALSRERASDLRRILRQQPATLLIENDPLGPVAGTPAMSLADAGVAHWVVIRSTSKFLGPDLRLAALTGDARTIARVEGRLALGARWVSTILQRLVLALWSDPSSGRLLARAAEAYAHRRTALLKALAAHGITAAAPSGFNVWIPVRHEAAVVTALAAVGWGVMAGEACRLRSAPGIRVTASALLPPAADRFAADLAAASPMASSRGAAC
jgi:DNA-binding transcriptional MocR family regulator